MEKLYIPTQTEYEKVKAETRSAYVHLFIVPTCESEIPSVEQLQLCGTKNLQLLSTFLDQRHQALEEERSQIYNVRKGSFSGNLNAEPLYCTLEQPEGDRLGQACVNCCPVARQLYKQTCDVYKETHAPANDQEPALLPHELAATLNDITRELASKTLCALGSTEQHVGLLNNLDERYKYLTNACNALTLYRTRLKGVPPLDLPIFIDNRNQDWIGNGSGMCYFIAPDDTEKIAKIQENEPDFQVGQYGSFIACRLEEYTLQHRGEYYIVHMGRKSALKICNVDVYDPFLMHEDELEMLADHPEAIGMWAETRNDLRAVDLAKLQPLYNYFHSLGGK